jgi:hypothetical protein
LKLIENEPEYYKEVIKSMVYPIPIILAQNINDNRDLDHYFYKGCRKMFDKEYEKAIK